MGVRVGYAYLGEYLLYCVRGMVTWGLESFAGCMGCTAIALLADTLPLRGRLVFLGPLGGLFLGNGLPLSCSFCVHRSSLVYLYRMRGMVWSLSRAIWACGLRCTIVYRVICGYPFFVWIFGRRLVFSVFSGNCFSCSFWVHRIYEPVFLCLCPSASFGFRSRGHQLVKVASVCVFFGSFLPQFCFLSS